MITATELRWVVLINHPSGWQACSIVGAFADEIDAQEYAMECRRRRDPVAERILGCFGYVVCCLSEPLTAAVMWEPT